MIGAIKGKLVKYKLPVYRNANQEIVKKSLSMEKKRNS
jgi:hypothetical protein